MNLQGIAKLTYRDRIVNAYQVLFDRETLPSNQYFFTLGGLTAGQKRSELSHLCFNRGFIRPSQYVSVENNRSIHKLNCRVLGPTWIYGDFGKELPRYLDSLPMGFEIGIINVDLMCGIDKALPTIHQVIDTVSFNRRENNRRHRTLIVFNVLKFNRQAANFGIKFERQVWETMKKDRIVSSWLRSGAELIDREQYHNKTVGLGSRISCLETLIFTF